MRLLLGRRRRRERDVPRLTPRELATRGERAEAEAVAQNVAMKLLLATRPSSSKLDDEQWKTIQPNRTISFDAIRPRLDVWVGIPDLTREVFLTAGFGGRFLRAAHCSKEAELCDVAQTTGATLEEQTRRKEGSYKYQVDLSAEFSTAILVLFRAPVPPMEAPHLLDGGSSLQRPALRCSRL